MDDRGSDVHVHRDRTRADPHGIFNGKVSVERNICISRGYGDLCGIRDRRRADRRKKDEEKKIPVGTVIRKPVLFDPVCCIGSISRRASKRSGTYGNDTWNLYGGRNTWRHDELKNAFQLKNIML